MLLNLKNRKKPHIRSKIEKIKVIKHLTLERNVYKELTVKLYVGLDTKAKILK